MRDRRGFTLVEVVVGFGLLALLATAFFSLQRMAIKTVKITSDTSDLARAMTRIEEDIMQDMIFLPPQETQTPEELAQESVVFLDPTRAGRRCYDRFGTLAATCPDDQAFDTDNGLAYRVRFFKEWVRDGSLDPASPLARIPVSRVRLRIEYKVDFMSQTPVFMSRLVTGVMRY